jgi:trichohyalin
MLYLKNKRNKLVLSNLDIYLAHELGFFSLFKGKKIRLNPKPFSNETINLNDENLIDLHLQIVKKIDELIGKHEKELQNKEPEPLSKRQKTLSLLKVVEIREPSIKRPEMPNFKTDIETKNVFGELSHDEGFFEIEIPHETSFNDEKKQADNSNFNSWMLGDHDKKSQKSLMGLLRVKVRSKNRPINQSQKVKETKKTNNYAIAKNELEQTKKEIEQKKKALEEAKIKEKELIQKIEEKKKEEKFKKFELKKKMKEKIVREKEAEKARKQKDKELKRLEQEKLKQEQIKIKEKEKIEKQKELERKKKKEFKHKKSEKKEVSFFKKEKEEEEKLTDVNELQKELEERETFLDDDVEKLIPIIDQLLEKLPDDVIEEFAQSKDFILYEKVVSKYKNK